MLFKYIKKKIIFIFMFTMYAVPSSADYIAYKMIDGNVESIVNQEEYKSIYKVLMRYQFPMNANPENFQTNPAEKENLELVVQKNVNEYVKLLWVPRTLFEHFTINYFLRNWDKEEEGGILKKMILFQCNQKNDPNFSGIMSLFEKLFQGSDESKQEIEESISLFFSEKRVPFLHDGFPVDVDPMCKESYREYNIASNEMNHIEMFIQANFLVNKELFNFLYNNDYLIVERENLIVPQHSSLKALNSLAEDLSYISLFSDEEDEARENPQFIDEFSVKGSLGFVCGVDKCLKNVFNEILSIEYEAYENNFFVLYRGTNGIEDKLDSVVEFLNDGTPVPRYLSYGSGIYAAALGDVGTCPASYALRCNYFYALLIDKESYLKNVVSGNLDSNLVHIHPYNTIISLFGGGFYSHPYVKSFRLINDLERTWIKFFRPPLFLNFFGSNLSVEGCEERFVNYFSPHVRMIL